MNAKQPQQNRNRVAIVGCDELTPYRVYSLLISDEIDELVLVGELPDGLVDSLNDLKRALRPAGPAAFRLGQITDAAEAGVVVIGSEAWEGRTGIDREIERVERITRELNELGFNGVLLITVEPVEAVLRAVSRKSNPGIKVFGLGSAEKRVHSEDTGTSVWCTGALKDLRFTDLCDPECPYFHKVQEGARRSWDKSIDSRVGEGDVAICVTRVCEAILGERKSLIPVWVGVAKGEVRWGMQIVGSSNSEPAAVRPSVETRNIPAEVG